MPFGIRPDGVWIRDLPLTRRVMPFIMRTRNECAVYFEQKIVTDSSRRFLEQFRERTGMKATFLHLLIFAAARALNTRPRLNRFVAGGRIYQRNGIWISFSAKKAKTDGHPIVVVKRRIDPSWTFETLVREIESGIEEGRSDRKSATDKELRLAFLLPSWAVGWVARLLMWLDSLGLLPKSVIDNDPLYSSLFIANLGSIGMDAAYHHLYEYGNIPIFMAVGKEKLEPVVTADQTLAVLPVTTLRYTLDERIEDGLYCYQSLEMFREVLEDPFRIIPIPS